MAQPQINVEEAMGKLMGTASSFIAAKLMFAATDAGIFEYLGGAGASAEAIAHDLGLNEHATVVCMRAMHAMDLVTYDGERYYNTGTTMLLSGKLPMDMRPIAHLFDTLVYEYIDQYKPMLKEGKGYRGGVLGTLDPEEQKTLSEGVAILHNPSAFKLAEVYDFSGHNHLVDIGGGTGNFMIPILPKYPHLTATIVELPDVIGLAEETLAKEPFFDRVDFVGGDLFNYELPQGTDVILMANALHIFSPEQNMGILTDLRSQVSEGAVALLISFWTSDDGTEPKFASLLSGVFVMFSGGTGQAYPVSNVSEWLDATGWVMEDYIDLPGPQSLIVARAI